MVDSPWPLADTLGRQGGVHTAGSSTTPSVAALSSTKASPTGWTVGGRVGGGWATLPVRTDGQLMVAWASWMWSSRVVVRVRGSRSPVSPVVAVQVVVQVTVAVSG